jgi:hypothetical protein
MHMEHDPHAKGRFHAFCSSDQRFDRLERGPVGPLSKDSSDALMRLVLRDRFGR